MKEIVYQFLVDDCLDKYNSLQVYIEGGYGENDITFYLEVSEIKELRDHLNDVLNKENG